jgi:hypothetical protein
MRHAKGDRVRVRTITSEMPAVIVEDTGGTNVALRPIWHDGAGPVRQEARRYILDTKPAYTVEHSKAGYGSGSGERYSSGDSRATTCGSLAAAMAVVAEVMSESPRGETVDRVAVRSASGYQVFIAIWREADGWRAFDDTAFRR